MIHEATYKSLRSLEYRGKRCQRFGSFVKRRKMLFIFWKKMLK